MDKLVNKAWADMEKKLDTALPTAKQSKKRIFPLLVILLIALVAGGAGIILMIQKADMPKADEQKIQQTTVDYALKHQPGNDRTLSVAGSQNTESREHNKSLNASGKPKTPKAHGNSNITSGSVTGAKQNNSVARNGQLHASMKIEPSETAISGILNSAENFNDQVEKPKQIVPSSVLNNYSTADLPALKQFSVNPTAQNDQFSEPMVILPLSFGKNVASDFCRHAVQFHSGLLTENIAGFSGLEFGLTYNRYFSSGFFLQTGLNYSWMNKKYFSNALLRTGLFGYKALPSANASGDWVERRYDYELKNSDIRNNEIAYEYVVGLVDHLHYLNIPLHLGYRFNRLKIFGGLNLSWLMYGSNAVRDLSEQYFNTIILSEEVLFNKQLLNRFDLSPQMGMEFKLWKGLGIYAYYNHGLVEIARAESASKLENVAFSDNYINESSVARIDKNRYFVIGFNYQLDLCNMK